MSHDLSTSVRIKYYYDDADGTPVDITREVLAASDIKEMNLLEQIDSYGVAMAQFIPGGKGKLEPITLNGLFKIGSEKFDDLFGNRVPEDPDTATRTLTVDMLGDGTWMDSVETHLESYTKVMPKENSSGLVRAAAALQPTGEITRVRPT